MAMQMLRASPAHGARLHPGALRPRPRPRPRAHGGASQNMLYLRTTARYNCNDRSLSHSHPADRRCLPLRDSSAPYLAMPGEYEESLRCLSSLITRRARGDGANRGEQFDLMFHYLKILDLEDAISRLKVIHVAGTKGKGSTCTFTESSSGLVDSALDFSLRLT